MLSAKDQERALESDHAAEAPTGRLTSAVMTCRHTSKEKEKQTDPSLQGKATGGEEPERKGREDLDLPRVRFRGTL